MLITPETVGPNLSGVLLLKIAAGLSFVAAILHIAIIFGGPQWYRFFGAGEGMAKLAEMGSYQPAITTLIIAAILFLWGLYGLSGAGVIPPLPLQKLALCTIAFIYVARGLAGFILPFITNHPAISQNSVTFWLVSSTVCTLFGVFYLLGTVKNWSTLG
ncbi:hypothetical protein [Planctobacterium marinum]|uniref:Uncharacterized protein n=1 Tax=Planctobacterium marinum TaxID=1631968 RepID=A0AA48HDU2_9ALTE|nr:hypothetical protein MACH26_06740 [Planctobacterium marinum]